MASGGADKQVKLWDFDLKGDGAGAGAGGDAGGGAALKQLTLVHTRSLKLTDEVQCMRYSNHTDAAKLLLALMDNTIKVYFEDTLKFFLSLYGHKLPVTCLDVSTDNTLLLSGSADKNVKIWGLDFGDCHRSLFAHQEAVTAVAFVPRTHMFFTAGKDKIIKVCGALPSELLTAGSSSSSSSSCRVRRPLAVACPMTAVSAASVRAVVCTCCVCLCLLHLRTRVVGDVTTAVPRCARRRTGTLTGSSTS
jgi:WD40 repeat protein